MLKNYENIGQLIDAIVTEELELEKELAKLQPKKKLIKELRGQLEENFDKAEILGARGERGKASLVKLESYKVADFNKFKDYVTANDAFDLLNLTINKQSYRDRAEERNAPIPGVTVVGVRQIRITKIL